jgi:hypothetical protein
MGFFSKMIRRVRSRNDLSNDMRAFIMAYDSGSITALAAAKEVEAALDQRIAKACAEKVPS